jgi:tRNA-binding protein
MEGSAERIAWSDFERVDVRVGTITDAQPFPEARKPAIRLWVDFGGALGVRKSSAQLTVHYRPDRLIGRQVVAVVNFRRAGLPGFRERGPRPRAAGRERRRRAAQPGHQVPDGGKMF